MFADFDVTGIEGLYLTGGATAVSDRALDSANAREIPGYNVFDLGARNEMKISERPPHAARQRRWSRLLVEHGLFGSVSRCSAGRQVFASVDF